MPSELVQLRNLTLPPEINVLFSDWTAEYPQILTGLASMQHCDRMNRHCVHQLHLRFLLCMGDTYAFVGSMQSRRL